MNTIFDFLLMPILLQRNSALWKFFIVLCCSVICNGIEIACDDDECLDDPCCLLTVTAINVPECTISGLEDDTVRLFDSSRNRQVEFLPIRMGEKFPSLMTLDAQRCKVKEISKLNFENLFHLRTLNLNFNKLEAIQIDTFKDLVSLESLFLGKFFLFNLRTYSSLCF